jgi:hypothetical protein
MNPHNSHTHCQVAQADTQAKTWQRVCLSQPTTDRQSGRKKNTERTTSVWRNGGFSASYDSFVVGSSAVLRLNFCAKNPPLRQAAKRYLQAYRTTPTTFNRRK